MKPLCGICNKELSDLEMGSINPYDNIYTCVNHKEYREVRMPMIIQKKIGIIDDYPESKKKCIVCSSELNQEELDTLTINDNWVTCNKHREVRDVMQIFVVENWFKYKELFPNAILKNEKDTFSFMEWWRLNIMGK